MEGNMLSWTQAYSVTDCARATSENHSSFSSSRTLSNTDLTPGEGTTFVTSQYGTTRSEGVHATTVVSSSSVSSFHDGSENTQTVSSSSTSFESIRRTEFFGVITHEATTRTGSKTSYVSINGIGATSHSQSFSVIFLRTYNNTVSSTSMNSTSEYRQTTGTVTSSTLDTSSASGSTTQNVPATIQSWNTATETYATEATATTISTGTTNYEAGTFTIETTYTYVSETTTELTFTLTTISSTSQTLSSRTATERVAFSDTEWMWSYLTITDSTTSYQPITSGSSTSMFTYRPISSTEDTTFAIVSAQTYTITFDNRETYTLTYHSISTQAVTETISTALAGIANSTVTVAATLSKLTSFTQSFSKGTSYSVTGRFTANVTGTQTSTVTIQQTTFLSSSLREILHSVTYSGTTTSTETFTALTYDRTTYTTSSSTSTGGSSETTSLSQSIGESTGQSLAQGNTSHRLTLFYREDPSAIAGVGIYSPEHVGAIRIPASISYTDSAYLQAGPGAINEIPWGRWSSVQHNVFSPVPGSYSELTADVYWMATLSTNGHLSWSSVDENGHGSGSLVLAGNGARDNTGYEGGAVLGGFNEVPGVAKILSDQRLGFWRQTIRNSTGGTTSATNSQTATTYTTAPEISATYTEAEIGGKAQVTALTIAEGGVPGVSTGQFVYIPGFMNSEEE